MEPAGNRQEHRRVRLGAARTDRAAMEPIGYQREPTTTAGGAITIYEPQWSPPIIGGSTRNAHM